MWMGVSTMGRRNLDMLIFPHYQEQAPYAQTKGLSHYMPIPPLSEVEGAWSALIMTCEGKVGHGDTSKMKHQLVNLDVLLKLGLV